MHHNAPEYEVRIHGQTLVEVLNGHVKVEGKDFHKDVRELAALIQILSNVLETAKEVKKPRVVFCDKEKSALPAQGRQAPLLKIITG